MDNPGGWEDVWKSWPAGARHFIWLAGAYFSVSRTVGSPGSRCPAAEPLFLRVCMPLSGPEQLPFEKTIGSSWDLHYYSLANHSANIC